MQSSPGELSLLKELISTKEESEKTYDKKTDMSDM